LSKKKKFNHDKSLDGKEMNKEEMSLIDEIYEEVIQRVDTPEQYISELRKSLESLDLELPSLEAYFLQKLCEHCKGFKNGSQLLLCDICDDGYHTYCLVRIIPSSFLNSFLINIPLNTNNLLN
jgi:hypothetical protein